MRTSPGSSMYFTFLTLTTWLWFVFPIVNNKLASSLGEISLVYCDATRVLHGTPVGTLPFYSYESSIVYVLILSPAVYIHATVCRLSAASCSTYSLALICTRPAAMGAAAASSDRSAFGSCRNCTTLHQHSAAKGQEREKGSSPGRPAKPSGSGCIRMHAGRSNCKAAAGTLPTGSYTYQALLFCSVFICWKHMYGTYVRVAFCIGR